jgi:hypothetical protein
MSQHVVAFYKNLFGEESRENIRLGGDFLQESDKVLSEENGTLEAEITEEEVRQTI